MDSVYIDYRYYYESSNLDQLYIDRSFTFHLLLSTSEIRKNTSSTENNVANERRNLWYIFSVRNYALRRVYRTRPMTPEYSRV